ncbi:ubiquitin-conjugating enzyme/RWD-like protein [Mycena galopus ATCC 62051]|nr:ubiquitin-conjugating enzyme/RWD-like protein [Mycena galopus ATCC 62051]
MAHPLPATLKRIHKEVADVKKEDLGSITLVPTDDLFVWNGTLPGPEGSVYDGGIFNIAVNLPPDYPFSAPKVTFKTKIYHMNISDQGNICIDILKHNWSPALSLFKVILSLSSLLTDPNPKDPLVPSIAAQYTRNRKLHDSTARQWTDLYARPKPPPPPPRAPPAPTKSRVRPGTSKKAAAPTPSLIVIDDDSDDEGRARTAGKRKRPTPTESVSVDDDDEVTEVASGSQSKRRAVGERRVAASGSSQTSSSRRPLIIHEEVIEIDDD